MIQNRNSAIDILKFLAVFLVMNSHMKDCYPQYQYLSTGGAIGDALFFYASGFTLFLGRDMRFDQWYKRRINRIYPSILSTAIIAYLIWGIEDNIFDILIGKRYWFIGCIMVYYIFIYPIKKINNEKYIHLIFACWLIAMIGAFFTLWGGNVPLYSGGLYRSMVFFLFMLQGAIMGKHADSFTFRWWHLLIFIISLMVWFYLIHEGTENLLFIFSLVVLLIIVYCLFCICNSNLLNKLYNTRVGGRIIYIISQLCLEVYLIQKFVFSDVINHLFPWNIPIIMLVVISAAYLVKMLANLISQTSKIEPYEWKKIFVMER